MSAASNKHASIRYQLEQALAAAKAQGLENFEIRMEGRRAVIKVVNGGKADGDLDLEEKIGIR